MELLNSKTEQNLKTAFAGESQARGKYTYYASKAKKEGYEQIASIFEETAQNEQEHAKLWFKLLHGGEVPTTSVNLLDTNENGLVRVITTVNKSTGVITTIVTDLSGTVITTPITPYRAPECIYICNDGNPGEP